MRGEGVIDEGDAALHRVISDLLGRPDAADAAGVDLDEADLAIIDEMARHIGVVAALARGQPHGAALLRQRSIGVERAADEGLLEPQRLELVKRGDARGRRRQIVDQDGAGIDEEDAVGSEALACRGDLVAVVGGVRLAERPPAEFYGAEVARPHRPPLFQRRRRIVAEEQRGIRPLRVGLLGAEQFIDRRPEAMTEEIPQSDLDARECMVGLQQIEAVARDEAADARDVADAVERLAEHGIENRQAGTVRARADRRGDRDERRGLALTPADMAAGCHADEQRILTAVALEGDFGHREIKEIDGFDLHWELSLGPV